MGGKGTLTPRGWRHFIGTMDHALTHWPEDVVQVFVAIERLAGGGHLSPETLQKVSSTRGAVLGGTPFESITNREPKAERVATPSRSMATAGSMEADGPLGRVSLLP